eukprot:Gregarina_sp_Pseudo_9__5829@NODE_893_length_2083_cov_9_492661_g838_i0_p4_GENE_NODE_893_length_2083_cov_9_492661_g838_i0NODE_893_length_2083_cov_9_492661_g838_i0_p4_ORF_typecomplete_len136_score16_45_NODE_893_length_2083_cov_9_492661_g838_i015491956
MGSAVEPRRRRLRRRKRRLLRRGCPRRVPALRFPVQQGTPQLAARRSRSLYEGLQSAGRLAHAMQTLHVQKHQAMDQQFGAQRAQSQFRQHGTRLTQGGREAAVVHHLPCTSQAGGEAGSQSTTKLQFKVRLDGR